MESPVSVSASFPQTPAIVRAALADPVLLSGWLDEDPETAAGMISLVDAVVEELGEGSRLVVSVRIAHDDLARARFNEHWRRRLDDLYELLAGRPVDWASRGVTTGSDRVRSA